MASMIMGLADQRPEYRVAVFGLADKLRRVLHIVLRHARHNRYRFVLSPTQGIDDFDIALVDVTVRGGMEVAHTLRRLPNPRPVVTVGRRNDPRRVCDDLLQQQFTMNVLPILNGTVETYRLRSSTSASAAHETNARRPRALVVDDSPTVRHQLSLALLRMGVESEAVGNADDALQALDGYRYDVAILDVVIPGMDGFRLARQIKRDPKLKTTPVIMLTSRSSPWDLARGALAGCNSYLVKPVSPKSLRETVLRNLAHGVQSRRRELARERAAVSTTIGG